VGSDVGVTRGLTRETCGGKLTLTGKSTPKTGKKAKTETIGTSSFSIPAGKTVTVRLTLNATGRACARSRVRAQWHP
jgi:hypothetical protein